MRPGYSSTPCVAEYGESNPTWITVRSLIAALGLSVAEFGRELDAGQRR